MATASGSENESSNDLDEKVGWSESEDEGTTKGLKQRGNKTIARNRVSGSKGANPKRGKKRKSNNDNGDSDSDSNHHLPEYLRKRKTTIEQADMLGLRLPPDYENIEFSDDERLEDLEERPHIEIAEASAPYEDIPLPESSGLIPAPIAQWLREYQVQGTAFLHKLFIHQQGGILGDDMGLGKTIQVIAFLTAAFGKTGDERDFKRMRKMRRQANGSWYPKVMVVCPGGLMENWKSEFDRWGWWHHDAFHGTAVEKAAVLEMAKGGHLEVMITTYTTYRLNKDVLNMIEWDCVIADECHQIKGRKSETTRAMNDINALCRIGLSGTAIQNNYEELWTLLNWTSPGKLGPVSAWKIAISAPLQAGQSHDATNAQLERARTTAKRLATNLLPQFFLRREKSLIAHQLPKKRDQVVFCPLTNIQQDAYTNFVESELVTTIRTATDPCYCGSGKKRGWCHFKFLKNERSWQSYTFPCLETLRKLSNHLALLIPASTDDPEKQETARETLKAVFPETWNEMQSQRDSIVNYANQDFCGKWKVLKKLLKFWHSAGDKVLVFSYSVRLLRMLQTLFNATTSYNVSYLDGTMSYFDRSQAVDDFNNDANQFVFLISTRAGGVGLNITSANKVVVVDPNWNPSHDLQAQDRAYRIGQVRDVDVFRLVSAGTIEEIIYARQIYKQQQANIGYHASSERRYFSGVQADKDKKGEIFGIANLFAFQGDHVVLQNIVNKTNVAESRAGVSVIGLDVNSKADDDTSDEDLDDLLKPENDEDDDAVMFQLAALIADDGDEENKASTKKNRGRKKKTTNNANASAIQAILASAGVSYTHENSEVIGSSKTEQRLSRRAAEAANETGLREEHVFARSQQLESTDSEMDIDDAEGKTNIARRYRPPLDVRQRQFCSMADMFGYDDVTEFALLVESWTQAQRRTCLEKFYKMRANWHDNTQER